MSKIDKEMENAIRLHIERILKEPDNNITNTGKLELNIVRPLSNHIIAKAGKDFLFSNPMYGWWDLTSACNFRCVHCLYNDTEYSSQNDLSHEQAMNLADDLIEAGIVEIMLTGGEIFMRPDTLDIAERFKENNISVKLLTNAALINNKHIDRIANMFNPYLDMLQISLDAATHETFKKIRQTDSFETIISNIKKLTDRGVRVVIGCTVNQINYNEILQTYNLASELGVSDFMAGKMIYHNKSHAPLMVSDRDLLLLEKKLTENQNSKTNLILGLFPTIDFLNVNGVKEIISENKYQKYLDKLKTPKLKSCHLNDRIRICSNGDMYLCMEADSCPEAKLGNYKENSFSEIWNKRNSNVFFQPRILDKMVCKNCKYNVICNSGCMVKGYKRCGSICAPEIDCVLAK